jgi:hypothetical protein
MAILEPTWEVINRQKVQPTEGERTLLKFLEENLDNTYEIFFQPYLNGDNPDIAILRKGSGLLIIEVKDWELSNFQCNSKTNWELKSDGTVLKSPLNQVDKYKSNLFKIHSEVLFQRNVTNKNYWATVNCAVYFHKSERSQLERFLLDDFMDDQHKIYRKFVSYFGILGKDSLTKSNLSKLLTKFWLDRPSRLFDDALYKSLRRYLKSPLHQLQEGKQIIYSAEQKELIRSEKRPRRKIKGIAGSGKTLVLAKRAVEAHKRTQGRVLILTYNLSLKNYIHDRISDVRENFYWNNFYITNYHQFFKTQANNYNLVIENLGSWDNSTFFEKVKAQIQKFDVIFIDEIQDYKQAWINILATYFMHEETEFVVFGDEKQNIYHREMDENNEPIVRTIPGVWNRTLNTSFRFSSNIGNLAIKFQREIFKQKYTADDLNVLSEIDFEQRIIEYHLFHKQDSESIFETIYSVVERNAIHSSDVGVLCATVELMREIDYLIRTKKNEKTTTTFESKEESEKYGSDMKKIEDIRRYKKNHFWMKTGTVKLSTIHSFKGWEIDTLFLIIEKENDTEFANAELIYTALTRAKRNLVIFNIGNKKYNDFFKSEIQNKFEYS